MSFTIKSIAKYLPANIIGSETLDRETGMRAGWTEKTTGVRQRHRAAVGETVSSMGARALVAALNKAGLTHQHLDLLIYAGGSFDYPLPHNSAVIKSMISDDTATFNCMDVDTACLSFIQALDIAQLYLDSGRYARIAIVCSEMPSVVIHPSDPKVYGLFGDAAVAVILEKSVPGNELRVLYTDFENYSSGAMLAAVHAGGAVKRNKREGEHDPDWYFRMDGRKLVSLATKHLGGFIGKMERKTSIAIGDIDHIIPHQPSKIGNDLFARKYRISPARMVNTLPMYGNCVSASIALGMEEVINRGDTLAGKTMLLVGTGAGFTFGAMLLRG